MADGGHIDLSPRMWPWVPHCPAGLPSCHRPAPANPGVVLGRESVCCPNTWRVTKEWAPEMAVVWTTLFSLRRPTGGKV